LTKTVTFYTLFTYNSLEKQTTVNDKTMSQNVKTIKIIVPNEEVLKKINNTPTLKNLSRLVLNVGENIERVNHYQFSQIMRMFPIVGCNISEI
jgi:hypothetical protein